MNYYKLLNEAEKMKINIIEASFPVDTIKGLYINGNIIIDNKIETEAEKVCILAEEIGHAKYTFGDIIDQESVSNIKQENIARKWAFEELLPLSKIIQAFNNSINSRYELSEFLAITEDFINEAIKYYNSKYGSFVEYDDYYIFFSPLGVLKKFRDL